MFTQKSSRNIPNSLFLMCDASSHVGVKIPFQLSFWGTTCWCLVAILLANGKRHYAFWGHADYGFELLNLIMKRSSVVITKKSSDVIADWCNNAVFSRKQRFFLNTQFYTGWWHAQDSLIMRLLLVVEAVQALKLFGQLLLLRGYPLATLTRLNILWPICWAMSRGLSPPHH